MKLSLAIKTLFRTFGKTLLIFLLISVLTFSLFIQLAEYVKTTEEFKENVTRYSGTGYVEYQPATYKGANVNYPYYIEADPRVDAIDIPALDDNRYPALSAETVDAITQLPYISSVYKRFMTAGVSEDYMRLKEDMTRYDYNGRLILEGTIDQTFVPAMGNHQYHWNYAHKLRDVNVLAGDARLEDLLFDDGTVYFEAFTIGPEGFISPQNFVGEDSADWVPTATTEDNNPPRHPGDSWLVKHVILKNHIYGRHFQEQLKEGERYVFVFRFERQATERVIVTTVKNVTRESLQLYDWVSEHCCPAVWNITDAPENYLELPEYAPLKELIEVTETDLNTFDVVYADDMTAIRQIHDDTLHIEEGRWLTPKDTENDAKVCVIDADLAKAYGLQLGDSLSLSLGHTLFEQFYSLGAIASVPERFSDEWTEDAFQIVGIYDGSTLAKDADEPNWAYSMNTVFVPLSSLPLKESELAGHEFAPGELSFRVENAWDIEPFLERVAPQIGAMGLTLMFDDGGWMEVLEGYRAAQRLPLIRIVLLAFVTVTGLALSVYLFVSRKKKDYAIMRALGTPKDRSAKALLAPLGVLSLAAVLLGTVVGAVYSHALLGMVPPIPMAICLVGELAFTLLFAGLSIYRLSKLSPLSLLQGVGSCAKKARRSAGKKKQTETIRSTLYVPTNIRINTEPLPITKRPGSLRFRLRYVLRHIRRQGLKTALAVLLAALLVGAVVQFASLCAVYNGLRESTAVTVKFVNSLSLNNLQALEDEGYAKDLYYERFASATIIGPQNGSDFVEAQVVVTSDFSRFLENDGYEISLGSGYTEEEAENMNTVILGAGLMEQYEVRPRDTVRFGDELEISRVFSQYRTALTEYCDRVGKAYEDLAEEEAAKLYQKELIQPLDKKTETAEVLGSVSTQSGSYEYTVFTAGMDSSSSGLGTFHILDLVEFTLADNSRVEEMRRRGQDLTHEKVGAFLMDTEKLEGVIRTSNLLNNLYPAVIALALLIGAAMCALLVLQNTRDAAIMRAQGTTKGTTRSMLAVEQVILGVIGILLGLVVMLIWKWSEFAAITAQAGLFTAGYTLVLALAAFVSAALATKKNILELLQTKE